MSPTGQPRQMRPTGVPPGVDPKVVEQTGTDALGSEGAVTAEEQKQYDQLVHKALSFIHSERGMDVLLQKLNDPSVEVYEAAAQAAVQIIETVERQAKAAKVDLSPDVMFHAAADYVIPEIFEVGKVARIFPKMSPEEEQQQMAMALYEGLRMRGGQLLQDDPNVSSQAQDYLARKVAEEADAGELAPELSQAAERSNPELARAVQQAMSQMKGTPREVV